MFSKCFHPCRCGKDEIVWIMIIMKEFKFSICFISLSTNLNLSINIFIMSKLIKQAMIISAGH